MKNIFFMVMKALGGVIALWGVVYLFCLLFVSEKVSVWSESFQLLLRIFEKVRMLIYTISVIVIFCLLFYKILAFLKQRLSGVQFDYKSDFTKFKSNDKVKITFTENNKNVTRKVQIVSINAKKISFEDRTDIYECIPSEIKNIQKYGRFIPVFVAVIVVLTSTFFIDVLTYMSTEKPSCNCEEYLPSEDYKVYF